MRQQRGNFQLQQHYLPCWELHELNHVVNKLLHWGLEFLPTKIYHKTKELKHINYINKKNLTFLCLSCGKIFWNQDKVYKTSDSWASSSLQNLHWIVEVVTPLIKQNVIKENFESPSTSISFDFLKSWGTRVSELKSWEIDGWTVMS